MVKRSSAAYAMGALLVLVAWAVVTHQRVATAWQHDLALWRAAAVVSPQHPRARINHGRALLLAGDEAGAIAEFLAAVAVSFDARRSPYQQMFSRVTAQSNLAHLLARRGAVPEALRLINQAIVEYPLPVAYYNRGAIYLVLGRCAEAQADFALAHQAEARFAPVPCS